MDQTKYFVPSRDAATLLPIIIANVEPGTEIHTDEWKPFDNCAARGVQGRPALPMGLRIFQIKDGV